VAQLDPAPEPVRRELEPGERIDGAHLRGDGTEIAEDDIRAAVLQQSPDAFAERRQVTPDDGTVERDDDRDRRSQGHRGHRPRGAAKVIGTRYRQRASR